MVVGIKDRAAKQMACGHLDTAVGGERVLVLTIKVIPPLAKDIFRDRAGWRWSGLKKALLDRRLAVGT